MTEARDVAPDGGCNQHSPRRYSGTWRRTDKAMRQHRGPLRRRSRRRPMPHTRIAEVEVRVAHSVRKRDARSGANGRADEAFPFSSESRPCAEA